MRFPRPAAPWLLLFAALAAGCDSPTGKVEGPPAQLELLSGDTQQGVVGQELAQPLVARITDANGDPVAGYVVNFRVTSGGGSVFAGAAASNADGVVRERWTLGTSTADSQRVEVRALDPLTGAALVFATFRATPVADAPAAIGALNASALVGSAGFPLADSLAARVSDRFGNPVRGATVAWSVLAGGGAVSPAQSSTDSAGVARTQWTLGSFVVGTQRVQAAASAGVTTEFVAQAGTPVAAVLAVASGNGQTGVAGTALPQPLQVSVRLPNGQPVAGVPVVWTAGAGGGTVTPSTSFTDSAGYASTQWVLPTLAGGATVVAASPGLMPVGFSATAQPGPAATLERVSGEGQRGAPGSTLPQPLVVRARDAFGNAVAGAPVQWSVSGGGGTVAPAAAVTGANGTASAAWTLGPGYGVQQVTASSGALPPVSFSATSEAAIKIVVNTPQPNAVVGDTLRVTADIIASTSSVTSFTARVMDRVVNVVSGDFRPVLLLLHGLPSGAYVLQVRAHAVNGDSGAVDVPFIRDTPPTVVVDSPANSTVAQPEVRVDAECQDDDPLGCASVELFVTGPGISRTLLASGTTSLHTTVSLAPWDGREVFLQITGTDRRGQRTTAGRSVYVAAGVNWTHIVTTPGILFDFDAGRVLFAGPGASVRMANRDGSGEVTVLPVGASMGRLHPEGAIMASDQMYDWRSGVLTPLGGYPPTLRVAGTWAIWTESSGYTNLYRRDLASGTTVTVATDAGNTSQDVAANGDVAFWNSSYDIMRYRNGVVTPLTADDNGVVWNVYPVTDGVNVVFRKQRPCCGDGGHRIAMITADGQELVLTPVLGREPASGRDYAANGGWVAFTMPDAAGSLQVWTRSPAGTLRQATTLGTESQIARLGPDGQLAFVSEGHSYVTVPPYTSAPRDIGAGSQRLEWRGSDLIAFVGRSAFLVGY